MTIVVGVAYPAPGLPPPTPAPDLLPDAGHPRFPLRTTSIRTIALAGWSVLAIGLAFAEAIARLGARAVTTIQQGLTLAEWVALAGSVLAFSWYEGYRALHRRFVPAMMNRAFETATRSKGVLGWLAAPLRTLSLLDASRRELVRAWLSVALITLAVFLVRALPMPWRGVVDAGVASALLLGLCSMLVRFFVAVRP